MAKAKKLTRAALVRRVAQQCAWAIVRVSDGAVVGVQRTRSDARIVAQATEDVRKYATTILRVDLRVKGVAS